MRILFITQAWEPDEGPPQWRLRRFADALIAAGHHVSIVTAPPHYPEGTLTSSDPQHFTGSIDSTEAGMTVYRTAYREHDQGVVSRILDQAVVAASTLRVAKDLRGEAHRPDVVLAAVPAIPSALTAFLISRSFRIPLVIDLRDAWPDLLENATSWDSDTGTGTTLATGVRRALFKLFGSSAEQIILMIYRRASLIITTSEHLRRRLEAQTGADTVAIINSSVTDSTVPLDRPQSVTPTSQGPLRVLYGGTVGRAQGIANAVQAVDSAARSGARITLRIVGQGAEIESVRALATALGAPVEFFKAVPLEGMHQHYEWCDAALIHLRDWTPLERTIPSKLIEAMSRGIPVIVAANGEAAEIATMTGAGTAVPAMDSRALADVLVDWSSQGVPVPDHHAIAQWIHANADRRRNAARFVSVIESVADKKPSLPLVDRAMRFTGLVRHAAEVGRDDPVHLATLVSRRLPSNSRTRITRLSSSLLPQGTLRGLAFVIGDERGLAEEQHALTRTGRGKDLLGFHLNKPSRSTRRNMLARKAWELGDIDRAVELVRPGSRTAARWKSTKLLLTPGFELEPEAGSPHPLPPSLRARVTDIRGLRAPSPPTPTHSEPLRVLHVLTNSLPHTESGYAVRSHAVLRAQLASGISAAAVTRLGYPESIGVSTAGPLEVVDGVTYIRLPDFSVPFEADRRLARQADLLTRVAHEFQPHILHTTTNFEHAIVTREVARRIGVPWVYETRGEMEQTWLSRHSVDDYDKAATSQYYLGVRETESRLMRQADAVVALSSVQKVSHTERGVDPSRLYVVRNSIDRAVLDLPQRTSVVARADLGLSQAFTVGTVSSLVGYEGIDTLLRAIAELALAGHVIRGAIVGDGTERPELQSLAATLGVADRVVFPGRVPLSESVNWYDAIDVFCIPRRDVHVTRSVTPIKPLQAMARRRPLVVSDLDALTEITTDLGAGIAVTPDDPHALATAILQLKEDPALYQRCASAGREAVESTTWDSAASTYAELYSRLTEGPR